MRIVAALFLFVLTLSPARAIELTIGDEEAMKPVRTLVAAFIQPGFERFAEQAELAEIAVSSLCKEPGDRSLEAARNAFKDSALALARVEFLRTGPLAQENRLERLLFWPDRRGIALRQVQGVIAERDESVTDPANLPEKSVALQGYNALEYLLFGTGSDTLAEPGDAFRCGFAHAVAANIHLIAAQLSEEWTQEDGFAAAWTSPGPENDYFRNTEEAISELLSIPSEAFEIIRDQRLQPIVPEEDGKANPKSALFWRSDLTMPFIRANFDALRTYFEVSEMISILPEDQRWLGKSIEFEFNNSGDILSRLQMPVASILKDEDRAGELGYLVILTQSLQQLFGTQVTSALGLSVGFSSLDGD
tara:strand:- start:92827 stop:93912 length:1086 start_codon:yes stop_codon:yes gene_type:complete